MIVCLCHRVSDRDIAQAVRSGTTCFEILQDETLVASSGGCCLDCARSVFDQERARGRAIEPTTALGHRLAATPG